MLLPLLDNSLNYTRNTFEIFFLNHYLLYLFEPFVANLLIKSNETQLFLTIRKSYFYLFTLILKKHTLFYYDSLMDIWGNDFPFKSERFCINYLFNSWQYNSRLILKIYVKDLETQISLSSLFKSAGWLERECFDMFGIRFYRNGDLRRILTDYGFEGFPLRKDFPLSGFYELKYDWELKHIKFISIEVTQEFRFFYFQKVWK